MSEPTALVDAWILPPLAALAGIDRDAAAARSLQLAQHPVAFARTATACAAADLVTRIGTGGTWVFSPGDPTAHAFATRAVSRLEQDGSPGLVYDLAEGDEEHPAPWLWDLVRLLASLALARPDQKGSTFATLVARACDGYLRALEEDAETAPAADALPPVLEELLTRDRQPGMLRGYIATQVQGDGDEARLRTGEEASRDLTARAFFLPALTTLYPDAMRITPVDCVRLSDGPTPGRRRWRALVRERPGRTDRLRLLEIRERTPSGLAQVLTHVPLPPTAGAAQPATVVLGQDPLQRLLQGPARSYTIRAACHAGRRLDPATLSEADTALLARWWGLLLGQCHLRGARALRLDVPLRAQAIATELASARSDIARWAWEHARTMEKAHAVFRRIAQRAQA